MLVKIIRYNPVKGRGIFQKPDGTENTFGYRQLKDQKIIPPGKLARLTKDRFLCLAGRQDIFKWPVLKLFKGNIKWLS